jgi:hypothetical protein
MHEKKYMDKDSLMPKEKKTFSFIKTFSLVEKGLNVIK